jgi:RNA polymerase primary sigma factor
MPAADIEMDLCTRAKSGDRDAIDRLLKMHEGCLVRYARRFRSIDFDDALQEARIAAIEALENFDPTLGYRFLTFACRKILWRLNRIKETGGTIRTPTYANLAKCSPDAYALASNAWGMRSLDAPTAATGRPMRDGIKVENDPAREIERREELERLSGAFNVLTTREREVIRRRMGEETLEQIGERFGLTKERIRQIETKAKERLRLALVA